MSEYKECEDEKMDIDESGRRKNGWESKATPLPRQSPLCVSEWTFGRLHKEINTETHRHTLKQLSSKEGGAQRGSLKQRSPSQGSQLKR